MSAVVSTPEEQPRALRLLAVHAHPDDETLSTGALLATWADAGHHACVITCTRGEQGEVIPPELAHLQGNGPELAEVRTAELAAALSHLGVAEHHFLDALPAGRELVDSGMQWIAPGIAGPVDGAGPRAFSTVARDESATRLAAFIHQFQPDVVVTYEPGGGYGHPDHVQASAVAMRALQLIDATATVLQTVVPLATAVSAQAELRRSAEVHDLMNSTPELRFDELYDGEIDPAQLPPAVKPATGTLVEVDATSVGEPLRSAMRAYATQITAVAELREADDLIGCAALSNNVIFPIPDHEFHEVVSPGPLLADIDKIPGLRLVEGSTGSIETEG